MHVLVPLAQTPLQQSPSEKHEVSWSPQVSEQEEDASSQAPVQQSSFVMHEEPVGLQVAVVVLDPPAPVVPKPHVPFGQNPSQQSESPRHGVLLAAQARGPPATQMPSWHVAWATHVPPPVQSPSTSTRPAAGGTHWPCWHEKLAHSTSLLHGEPSGREGATAPVPPTSW
jgi:hypothetical protein